MNLNNIQNVIKTVYNEVKQIEDKGILVSYIPELAKVSKDKFGVFFTNVQGKNYGIGDYQDRFSIQSISKVLSLALAFQIKGKKIWERVGVEPSGTPFNSLIQLENDDGIPRNPFNNSGALIICDILLSELENPKKDFLQFIRNISDNPELDFSSKIVESEKSVGYRNVALCNLIKALGNLENSPEKVLDFYYNLCSIKINCKELAEIFTIFANSGCKISDNSRILSRSKTKRINAIMQSCGFYDESGQFTFKVGLPGKSGVGGGIIAIHPKEYALAVWSPSLNKKGNSFKGLKFLEKFTTLTDSSIF